jgi:hypothetical protein
MAELAIAEQLETHRTRTIDFAEKALLRLHDQRSKCARPNTLGMASGELARITFLCGASQARQ